MFRRRAPVYVAFDVLYADGQDLRPRPLRRKGVLKRLLRGRRDLVVMDGIAGEGRRLQAVCELDLEDIVAKRTTDPYGNTRWLSAHGRTRRR
jgi:bifunctional non-homologous end joining protein LigD